MVRTIAIVASLALLSGCMTPNGPLAARAAEGTLRNASGTIIGTVAVLRTGDVLSLTVAAKGLPSGAHGIHLHAVGRCDAPDFASAGGHLNPSQRQHGTLNPAGQHMGDLPNLNVDSSGVGALTVPLVGAVADLESSMFDADGTAVVIHAGPDDYKTDPSGNSGGRIACAVLRRV